ncbi:hypothetical protein Ctob_011675 [Chrysochromulina tobinii]|uniref:EF-hand domain-containing protein n=1 Tax=Chrysochromulina tobinii TaxID=1460289 RepID=A0A0M0K8Z7_9EUKA|nr:hypothetical protein Ctob_011675 [Chrysochromulina tobinii]|eukprot:KOO35331.1 hypothetical protein Ctob_011675 [Chrysochromulina sp. CCMP291]
MRRTIADHAHQLQWSAVDSSTLRAPVSEGDAFDVTLRAVWAAARERPASIAEGQMRQQQMEPPRPLMAGYCGLTAMGEGARCDATDSKGSWSVSGLLDCLADCRRCERCHFVSYSDVDHDCSWFRSCPAAHPSSPESRALKTGYIERQEGLITAKYLGAADKGEYWDMMLKEMDSDGDGKISKEEYVLWMFEKKAMRRELAEQLKEEIALKLNQHKALAAAASAPVDDLDIEEIPMDGSVAVAAPAAPAGKGLALQAKFKALDLDGDGSITKEELQDFHAMLSEDQIAKLFAKADKDGSNSITFDEFCAVVEAFEEAAKAEEAAMDGLLPE